MSTSIYTKLSSALTFLRMPAIRKTYLDVAETARQESLSYEEFLFELVSYECQERKQNKINRELKLSRLPFEKNLNAFDRDRLPMKINSQLSALLDGSFLDRSENVLAFGNPGSGKTHLLCAIGQELIYQGYRVCFKPCSLLVQELLVAKNELRLEKFLKKLNRFDALIIDDIGYVQYDRHEMEVLFTLLAERYERKSVMITSNLPFSKWEQIFKDPMTTAAAIDRLVHHSIILELNLPSYRLEESKKNKMVQSKPSQKEKSTKG
jgi:DNA replication protein DnaC